MVIGHVTGAFQISPYEFYIRLKSSPSGSPVYMPQIEDVVKTEFEYPGYGLITAYGVITDIVSQWDGEPMMGFEETLVVEKGIKKVLRTYVAKAVVTRLLSENGSPDVPPIPGSPVHILNSQEEIDIALGFDDVKQRGRALPVGVMKNNAVAYLDLDYILGENGAHVNISGQSGVASKTSYMMFLVKSLRDTAIRRNDAMLKKAVFIIFNVKGQSLMFVDRPSSKWKELEEKGRTRDWESMYEKMNLELKPFENVEFYAVRKSYVSERPDSLRGDAKPYWWTTDEIFDLDLFEMLFDPEELLRNNNLMLAVMMVNDFMNPDDPRERSERRRLVKSPFDLVKVLDDEKSDLHGYLKNSGELRKSTIKLLKRRLQLAIKMGLDRLWGVRYSDENKVNWKKPGWISVVDISRLRTKMQAFVVGAVLKDVMRSKEAGDMLDIPVFVMVDELNKYSPRHERSEIASIFRDIAERGRSFKVILIGAEQTASEVDYRVVTQSSTTVVGHQKWVELQKSEYGHLLQEQKRKAATLKQGEVIVDQPFLRLPLTVSFPFPVWALNERDAVSETSEEEFLV